MRLRPACEFHLETDQPVATMVLVAVRPHVARTRPLETAR